MIGKGFLTKGEIKKPHHFNLVPKAFPMWCVKGKS